MKLWLISQSVNQRYDSFDSAVVAAETESDARSINPGAPPRHNWGRGGPMWAPPDDVIVKLIGEAVDGTERGVICASFNAG